MPHGQHHPMRGPHYGAPPRREIGYDSWSHGPPPLRGSAVSPYASSSDRPPMRSHRSPVQVSEYHLHLPSHHHPPPYYGWRESSPTPPPHHHHHHPHPEPPYYHHGPSPPPPPPPPPPHYHHHHPPPPPSSHHHHEMARSEEYARPPLAPRSYLSMQIDRDPPPLVQYRRESVPPATIRAPQIQFRKETRTVSPKKSPAKSKAGKKKKGDALSLLAKVSSAMADPEDEEQQEETGEDTEGENQEMMDADESKGGGGTASKSEEGKSEEQQQQQLQQANDEKKSPVRQAAPSSPVAMWTPKGREDVPRPTLSRQITPVDHSRYAASWRSSSVSSSRPPPLMPRDPYGPPRYPPEPSYYNWPPPPPESPPVVISERNSFEEEYRPNYYPDREYQSPREETNHYAPYTYVQQPRMEDKTILRKKFSWKHYPELERFLIANRDEYFRHSALNYTAEQKQYNNWLTERLLEVAARHHYVFDPDEFNFVAVRDRIRCYYKSYVQTARKRGLSLVPKQNQQQQPQQKRKLSVEAAKE